MSARQQSPSTKKTSTAPKFRFVYSPEIESMLRTFAKEHEEEERKQFKQSWQVFVEENKPLLEKEAERITKEGYDKDVYAKMFHTIKYYYVKKSKKQKQQEECEETGDSGKERTYNKLGKEWIGNIVHFIKDDLEMYKGTKEMKPEYSFNRFLEKHTLGCKEFELRVKKSYKTQYYKIKTQQKNSIVI